MRDFTSFEYIEPGSIAFLKLNRPEKRNAINKLMISELIELFEYLNKNEKVILLQIVGKGDIFCSGADLHWMQELRNSRKEDIIEEFKKFSYMLNLLYHLPQITISLVHGAAYGGALGLLACSDYVVSSPNTMFAFSEIKLGLIPATIGPYVVKKIGMQNARRLFFSGDRFDENLALNIGLIDEVAQGDPSLLNYETPVERLLKQPAHALKSMKILLRGIETEKLTIDNYDFGTNLISELIASKSTQEELTKFFESR